MKKQDKNCNTSATTENHCCSCSSTNNTTLHQKNTTNYKVAFSLILLIIGFILNSIIHAEWFSQNNTVRLLWYIIAYIPVGFPVIKQAYTLIKKGSFFTEFTLMAIATIGAFLIGEYPEGVAVMIFYTIGEIFQDTAITRARNNIKALLDIRPNTANVLRNNQFIEINPKEVFISEIVQVKVGKKIPLDGELITEKGSFNTSALTGESKPSTYRKGEIVLAGMINIDNVIEIKTTKLYEDTSISKILKLVQEASAHKAPTELYIRKFAKIYTPLIFGLAVLLTIIPYFILQENYIFTQWLERALVFLVISCPCALVISVPLGYFGGIGAASKNGILFKGSNYLELMAKLDRVVMDKTGTITEGIFEIQKVETTNNQNVFIDYLSAIEQQSTHPIAKAITSYFSSQYIATQVSEIAGKGLIGIVNNKTILAGNTALLKQYQIDYPSAINSIPETTILVAIDNLFAGYVIIADKVKPDTKKTITELKQLGVKQTVILSGDKTAITQKIAKENNIDLAIGDLLPEDKLTQIKLLKVAHPKSTIAFVGDGINDAPALAFSDIGIAMGSLGSDAAIETADVVIQTDQPSKIATAIKIGKATRKIVIQNIVLALSIKVVVLLLGAGGLANMWEAVFADVGVALLAILNAIRIQKMRF